MSLLCRTCGESVPISVVKNLLAAEQDEIVNNILLLTGIFLTDNPDLPQNICDSCVVELNNAITFRNRCLEIHNLLSQKGNPSLCQFLEGDSIDQLGTLDPLLNDEDFSNKLTAKEDNEILNLSSEVKEANEYECSSPSSSIDSKHVNDSDPNESTTLNHDKTPTPTYFCDQCGKHFNDKSNLRLHLVRHTGIKGYQCPECNRREFNLYLLKLHIRVKHRGEKPFACKYCGECFVNSAKRCRHQKLTHETHKEKIKPYICGFCGQSYESKSTLKKHEIIHSGERPYQCDICNVSFNRKSNLQTHFRSKLHKKKETEF